MGGSYEALGDLDRARDMKEAALEIIEEINPRSADHGFVLMSLSFNRLLRGDFEGTDRVVTEAQAVTQEIDAVGVQLWVTIVQALMRLNRAQLEDARSGLDETYRSCEEAGIAPCVASLGGWLGVVDYLEDQSEQARQRMEKSIALSDEMGEPAALWRRALAAWELDAGRPESAEPLIRKAIEEDLAGGPDLLETRSVLAWTLAELGRVEEAESEIQAALDGIRDSQHTLSRLTIALFASQMEISLGRTAEARRRLEANRDEALELGWVTMSTYARLLLAQLELGSGDAASGLAALRAVEDDARALGLKRYARLAAESAATAGS